MSYILGKFGVSNLGNDSGATGTVNRQIVFAGGSNVTLSQAVNASSATVTMHAGFRMSAGTTSGNLAAVTFSNSNGVSFGLNGSTLTASHNAITSQTNQTMGLYVVGNTTVQNTSMTADARSLTFNGLGGVSIGYSNGSVQISGGAGGGGGGVALANAQTTFTNGVAHLSASGALTISTAGAQSFQFAVPQTSSLSASGIVSISTNGSTISIGAEAPTQTGLYFDNMLQQASQPALAFTTVGASMYGRLLVQPLAPGNELFPYKMTASTMRFNFSNSTTATSVMSAAHSSSWYFGLYTRVNSTQLSLLNSVSASYGMSANTGNSASYTGARWLSFHSSQFSAAPILEQGSRYFFGVMVRTAGATYAPVSMAGMHLGHSVQRQGNMAAAINSATSLNAWHPFMGVHTNTTLAVLPVSIANSEINKAVSYANFIPQIIFDAGLGQVG